MQVRMWMGLGCGCGCGWGGDVDVDGVEMGIAGVGARRGREALPAR